MSEASEYPRVVIIYPPGEPIDFEEEGRKLADELLEEFRTALSKWDATQGGDDV